MQINYIILAHKNPQQIQRLIGRLDTLNCHFYIHIDKGVPITPFLDALSDNANVFFIANQQREYGTWGDIGIVKATIAILSQIVKDNRNGYCILMSGQDYPLKNNESINTYFETNYGENYISTFPLPFSSGWGTDGGLNRLNQYKINLTTKRFDFIQLPSVFERKFYKKSSIPKLLQLLKKKRFTALLKLFVKRKFPKTMKPYGGEHWWAFPIETVKELLNFINSNPKYLKYHKNTLSPDEIFFHSVLMHLKEKKNALVIKPGITYVNWTRKNTTLPVIFKEEDIEELREASLNKLFARKFDIESNEKILDLIEQTLLK